MTHTPADGEGTVYGIRPHLPMTPEKAAIAERLAHMPFSPDAVKQLAEFFHAPELAGVDGLGYGFCMACGELWPCGPSRATRSAPVKLCSGCRNEIPGALTVIEGRRIDGLFGGKPVPDGEFSWCLSCAQIAFQAVRDAER